MKLKLLFLGLFFAQFQLQSQISLQFNGLNEYIFSSKEALNFTVINPNQTSIEVKFNGKISDANNRAVLEFTSNPAVLNPGANVFTPMTLGFSQLNYLNSEIAEIEAKTGTYPSGNYRICVMASCVRTDCNGAGPSAGAMETPVCAQVNVENPTPLLLAYPHDKSEIDETRPTYTWIPPAPIAGIGGLQYLMTLVEIYEGQSKSDALSMNRPLIEMNGINANTLMHPTDYPELEAGKSYAWQVQAFVGNTFVAKSEQWEFKVKKEKEIKDSIRLVLVAHSAPGTEMYIVRTDSFKFKYEEQYSFNSNEKLKFSIYNETNQLVKNFDESASLFLVKGVNDYKLDISFKGLWLKDGVYMLIIQNAKNEKWYLRFKVER